MPRGDRTGPEGGGPMTGRARGYCAGYDQPGCIDIIHGAGRGFGGRAFGFGRRGGWRRAHGPEAVRNPAAASRVAIAGRLDALAGEIAALRRCLDADAADAGGS
ncbi:MAG: DUF5320 domain-containing protein [Planctomycetota bacterium]